MYNHYGYIKGTQGADKDHLDVFLGKDVSSNVVYIVNQINPNNGKFDEHKVMLCFDSKDDAKEAYLNNYEKGWKGCGSIITVSLDDFKSKLGGNVFKKEIDEKTFE